MAGPARSVRSSQQGSRCRLAATVQASSMAAGGMRGSEQGGN